MGELITRRIHLSQVDSTNSEARRRIAQGEWLPEATLIDADCQVAGRGQGSNSWESEAGQNLQFSIVCRPAAFVRPAAQFVLSQCIALAVAEAVDGSVKWPNDIYIGHRKVSGTLIECDLRGGQIEACIIGTGVNVNQTAFRSDAPNPVSLRQLSGMEHDREALLQQIVRNFATYYDLLRNGHAATIQQRYLQRLYRREGWHAYADANGTFRAAIADIEPSGHLILLTEAGERRRYEYKEVKFLIASTD